jgi:hypothetical protein
MSTRDSRERVLAEGTVIPQCEKVIFYQISYSFTLKVA